MKELLKITVLKDSICSADLSCDTQHEKEMLAASLLSLMDKDEGFAVSILHTAYIYAAKRKAVSEITEKAIRSAEIKTKN